MDDSIFEFGVTVFLLLPVNNSNGASKSGLKLVWDAGYGDYLTAIQ